MERIRFAGCTCGIALLALGCVESTSLYTLNPDGSGKVEIETVFKDRASRLRRAAREIVEGSQGIDAWTAVQYGVAPEGRVRFSGTAYFKDVSAVRIPHALAFRPLIENGKVSIAHDKKEEKRFRRPALRPGARELTEEEIAAEMKKVREQYRAKPPGIPEEFGDLRIETVLRIPGKPRDIKGFSVREDGSLAVTFTGADYVAYVDRMMADDDWLREMILRKHGHGGEPVLPETVIRDALDDLRNARATFSGGSVPLFDYEAEAAPARAGMAKLLKELRFGRGYDGPAPSEMVPVWRDADGRTRWGTRYPWRSVAPRGSAGATARKVLLPYLGNLWYLLFYCRLGPQYLRRPYADEALGSAYLVPELEDVDGRTPVDWFFGRPSDYAVMGNERDDADGGSVSTRLSAARLSGPGESGSRLEARIDFVTYAGLWAGRLDVDGRDRTWVRFTNAFVMNTRAVASLDLGWASSERASPSSDDDGFEWGVNADLFPAKPWLVHLSYHELGGRGHPSDLRVSVGAALKACELSVGWTRLSEGGDADDFLEAGVRVWWGF